MCTMVMLCLSWEFKRDYCPPSDVYSLLKKGEIGVGQIIRISSL